MRPDTLKQLGASVGTDGFHDAGLAFIAELIPHDMEWIVVYDRQARPRTLRCMLARRSRIEVDLDLVRASYEDGFYRFDPFFRYWRQGGVAGVINMHQDVSTVDEQNPYNVEFMPLTHMADDVAVLLPLDDIRCVALTLERATRYSREETTRLRQFYPLLAGLNEAHLRIASTDAGKPDLWHANAPLDFAAAVADFTGSGFTPREREIVHLVLGGFPNKAIAKRLGIGSGTVRNHRKRLYAKLDITTERELFSLFLGYLARVDSSALI